MSDVIVMFCVFIALSSSPCPMRTGISRYPEVVSPGLIKLAYINHKLRKPYTPYSSGSSIVATYILIGNDISAVSKLTALN